MGLPKHDVSKERTVEAVKETIKVLYQEGFKVVLWISIPCHPWCSWQRVNLKIIEDYEKTLAEKRKESLELVKSVKKMVQESKSEAYFEWPAKNDGWKQEEVKDLLKSFPFEAEIDGCAYNLKNSEGRPMKKTWKIKSTNRWVSYYLNRRCKGHEEEHAAVRGKDGKASGELR